MLEKRVIPTLLLLNGSLVKTKKFRHPIHIGDPCNTVRIFNELGVDEIVLLDIGKRHDGNPPDFELLESIASEAFVPLSYGGGISNLNQAERLFRIGFEKVIVNSIAITNPASVTDIAREFGSQAVVGSIDYKSSFWGKLKVYNPSVKKTPYSLKDYAKSLQEQGVGELLITDVDREGTWHGLNFHHIRNVVADLKIPVIFGGGSSSALDIEKNLLDPNLDALAAGNVFLYQKKDCGVLINFPFKRGKV